MEFQVKFCHHSELRLWRTRMLLLTKSKGHRSNSHYSGFPNYLQTKSNLHISIYQSQIHQVKTRWETLYNLGPMHVLDNPKSSYNFVQDVYNRSKIEFVRPDKISTKNLIKSSAVSTFKKRREEKSHFPSSFWEN